VRYSNRVGHFEGERVNRGRDTPIFCPTLQVPDMSTLGDAADVNPVIKFLPHTCNACVWRVVEYTIYSLGIYKYTYVQLNNALNSYLY